MAPDDETHKINLNVKESDFFFPLAISTGTYH